MIVLLESHGIHFWCSSPVPSRRLVENGARTVGVAERAEEPAHLVGSAIWADELAPEELRTK